MAKRFNPSVEDLVWALGQTNSALAASKHLGLSYQTFIRRCREHGVYKTNQGGKGISKPNPKARIPLEKILSNEHFATGPMLKRKLLEANLIKDQCNICGLLPVWNEKKLVLQIDHIDGDRSNNALENLRLVCPNCHSQTPTFSRGKNKTKAPMA